MTKYKSMTDVAYEVMSKKKRAIPFKKLWEDVIAKMELDPEKATDRISQFYTDMTLDARFTSLKDNKWDLKERHKFEDVYMELEDFNSEEEEELEEVSEEESENIHKVDEEDDY